MSSWPESLPAPRQSDYSIETGDPVARTDMESGPARTRRRSTSAPDRVTLSFLFNEDQMATFRAFWEAEFLHGAAWVFVPIKDGRAAGVSARECRPTTGKFKAAPVSAAWWVVNFEVEVRHA